MEVDEHVLRRPNCIPAGERCADNSSTLDFNCACLLFNKLSGLSVEAQIYTENYPSFTFALSIIFKHNL